MHVGGSMQLRERSGSADGASIALGWLVWLLPGASVVVLVAYVLSATLGFDARSTPALIAAGRGGEIVGYLLAVIAWGVGQSAQAAWQNWPLVLVAATLAGLVWVLRNL